MTKRSKLTVGLASFCLSLTVLGGFATLTKGFTDFSFGQDGISDTLNVRPIDNIRFQSVLETEGKDGTVRKEILYTLEPASVKDENFNCKLEWNSAPGAGKESADWSNGKTLEDYMTYELDSSASRITFECKKAFGHQILFTMAAESNPDISASLTLDYRRKLLKNAAIQATPVFDPGKGIPVTVVDEVYSIGTVGDKAQKLTPEIQVEYRDSGTAYDDLFEPIQTQGIHSQKYKYLGQSYSGSANLLAEMKKQVKAYLVSIPSQAGSKKFDLAEFKKLLTYSYHAYTTYTEIYQETTKSFNGFIRKYKAANASGSGFLLKAKAGTKATYESLISLNLEASSLTNIDLSEDGIEF